MYLAYYDNLASFVCMKHFFCIIAIHVYPTISNLKSYVIYPVITQEVLMTSASKLAHNAWARKSHITMTDTFHAIFPMALEQHVWRCYDAIYLRPSISWCKYEEITMLGIFMFDKWYEKIFCTGIRVKSHVIHKQHDWHIYIAWP